MKAKCKKCDKKCNVNQLRQVECDNAKCDLKYNMSDDELEFANYSPLAKPMDLVVSITSPEPVVMVYTSEDLTDIDKATWLAMLESGQFSDGQNCPF